MLARGKKKLCVRAEQLSRADDATGVWSQENFNSLEFY